MLSPTLRKSATFPVFDGYTKGGKTKAIGGMLFVILLLASAPRSGMAQNEIPLGINPGVLRPINGKLPPSVSIAIYPQTCTDTVGPDLSQGDYRLSATGGLTPSNPPPKGKCLVTSTLTIDPSLSAGTYKIILNQGNKPVGHADLTVLDASAGALPPGLPPQVDVLWEVMSQKDCSDDFGKRVSERLYCIEVKIGNNSGYALQMAGIGFENKNVFETDVKQGNASYAATRAVLQRESYLSNRNIAYHSIEAAGLLMASFSPFFSSPVPKAHFATASSIVSGALGQAFDLIIPDRVPTQLSNLDDQSLRDGSVIANNTQVRTTIFVEKRALTEAVVQAVKDFHDTLQKQLEERTQKANALDEASGKKLLQSFLQEEQALAGKLEDDQEKTIANSKPGRFRGSPSPFLIRKALGDLVIVGDPIEYLPRVQIQSSSSGQSSSVVLSATSLNFTKGTAVQKVTLTNAGTAPLSINGVTPTGTDMGNFKVTANTCSSTVAAGAKCDITVTFTPPSAAGTQGATLEISDSASGSPQKVNLSGSESWVELGPPSLNFPSQAVGKASSSQKVLVTNKGTAPVAIPANPFGGTDKGLFSLDTTPADACGPTLPAGRTCGLYVVFTPTKAGSFSATLNVADDVHASAPTINLTGTGK